MNVAKLKRALQDLASAASDLAGVCGREGFDVPSYWRSISSESSAILASGQFDRASLDRIVRDVASAFTYHPGGFMELYVIRKDLDEQARENIAFERIRAAVLAAAGAVKQAAAEGEVNPLRIRHALVDFETVLLRLKMNRDAATAREMLNAPELAHDAVEAFGDSVLRHGDQTNQRWLRPHVRALKESLLPVKQPGGPVDGQ